MPRPARVVLLCVLALFVAAPAPRPRSRRHPRALALYKPPKKLGRYYARRPDLGTQGRRAL